ncbi:MAG: SDR family oxidoreductase [Chloroflexi bacterium]|nr:SDR family oxidoreductase [Chloroflexota bacterium]MCL5273591.1 SDR family oxidoreductase [Chloroflexota bacterium]
MNQHIVDKVAVVTGASRGIGAAIALSLASHGVKVALVARNALQLSEIERRIRDTGASAIAIPCDIADSHVIHILQSRVRDALGIAQILVNAAGVFGPLQLIHESDPLRWIETLTVNTIAPYLTCRAFAGAMIESGWGRIINVSSAAALHTPGPLNSAYGASKAALNQFTRHLASELKGTGVTANVIHPGEVKTDMWAHIRDEIAGTGPKGEGYRSWARWVDETGGDPPEKAADLVLRIISDDAATINGQFLWITEGLQQPVDSW